jgi:tyrosyl-tRNA synthetase
VLIIGDYTARVGDPSGRSDLRPMLSAREIDANAATFQQQALRILDGEPAKLEVRRNGEWLDMRMAELLELLRTTTAAQLLERDDFAKRWAANEPISVLELLYPLLQGYDSVAIDADVELGGTDQKFNLLLGRDIQRAYGKPEQAILTMPILAGTDGQRKMSKSMGNQIGITDPAEEVYGRTMSIPDETIGEWYRLLLGREAPSGVPTAGSHGEAPDGPDAAGGAQAGEAAATSPRDAKRQLARELVAQLYSPEEAEQAERHFDRVVVEKEAPEEIEEASFSADDGAVHLPELITEAFGISRSEARRLIDQGAVSLGEETLSGGEYDVPAERADGSVLRVGKRRFRRLRRSAR